MSANIVRNFFPGVESFLGPTLWTFFFPPHVEQLCPRPQLSLQVSQGRTLTVMWPAAPICCLLGMVIGFSYGAFLLYNALTRKAKKGTFTWGCAFLWYGMMSTGGLFYHCIHQTRVFYLLDSVSTACTCISLLTMYLIFLNSADDWSTRFRSLMFVGYGMIVCLALFGGDTIRNVLYLGPASLAFLVGTYFVVKTSKGAHGQSGLTWLAWACVNAFIALVSVPLDPWVCFTFGANFGMLFWFFLGCDLAMVCLYHFTLAVSQDSNSPSKLKPS